jgi:hypothetical protein
MEPVQEETPTEVIEEEEEEEEEVLCCTCEEETATMHGEYGSFCADCYWDAREDRRYEETH